MTTGPKIKCQCYRCRICNNRMRYWERRHPGQLHPGRYAAGVDKPRMVTVQESIAALDRAFPWLAGVEI